MEEVGSYELRPVAVGFFGDVNRCSCVRFVCFGLDALGKEVKDTLVYFVLTAYWDEEGQLVT